VRIRAALAAVVVGSLVIVGVGVSVDVATAGAPDGRAATVTVRGEFERLVIDSVDGETIRYSVRGTQTWWLEGVSAPVPAAGADVEVTGTPVDEYTLAVESIRVVAPSGGTSAFGTSAFATSAIRGSTRVLVLRAFWGARPPARPTRTTMKRNVINYGRGWFREVSHGRYTVSGVVTPWLRVRRPSSCFGGANVVMSRALRAAQRRGFNLNQFGRAILYVPCDAGGILGVATTPGPLVWLFNNVRPHVVVHEQGHNIGLQHASSRVCRATGWGPVTWSRRCQVIEYGDEIDAMGNRRPGQFNAFYKGQLRWLQRAVTVRSTRTVNITRHETTGPGWKAIRLRAGRGSFWLEYRTRTGADRVMPRGTQGLQIRYQSRNRTQLLDAGPGSTRGRHEFADTHLPVGSSWTTPQNVRITVVRQTRDNLTVAIRFRARPRPPARPAPAQAVPLVNAARITWTRPADNGSIIRRYRITRSDGVARILTTFAGSLRSYRWNGLNPNVTYRFRVQAVNQIGPSVPAVSPPVRPLAP
jgi:Fibronectin type III domain